MALPNTVYYLSWRHSTMKFTTDSIVNAQLALLRFGEDSMQAMNTESLTISGMQ